MAPTKSLAAPRAPEANARLAGLPRDVLVLGSEGTYGPWPGVEPVLPRTIEDIGAVVRHLGPRPAVYVHESALEVLGNLGNSPSKHTPPRDGLFSALGSYRTPVTVEEWSWSRWKAPDATGFHLHVPAWGRGPFAGARTAPELVEALAAWYTSTGEAEWHGWGTMTSDNLLRRRARRTVLPEPMTTGQVRELPMQWARPPGPDEANYRYLHGLDVNGQHLAVASSLELPSGEPELLDFPTFDKTVPGLWHVELPPWTDERFPPPWPTDLAGDGSLWLTTPTMERVVEELGAGAMEAWVWPEHGRYLRKWQETLRDARTWLMETGQWKGPAGAAVKEVYQAGPGRLYSPKRSASPPEADPLYQPYWYLAIVAEARCRLHRRVMALPVRPVAVYKDALYFLSSRESPDRLADVLGLPLGDRLGGFKAIGTIKAKEARAMLHESRRSPGAMAELVMKTVKAAADGD